MAEEMVSGSTRYGRFVRYAPLVLWIGVIFFLSTGQASMSETSRVIGPLLEFLFPSASEETQLWALMAIRKLAHVFVYATLAFFAARAFYTSSIGFVGKFWFAAAMLLVLIVASIDETNQAFTTSRTGTGWDVMLDVFGGAAMIIFILLLNKKWPFRLIFYRQRTNTLQKDRFSTFTTDR